MLPYFVVGSLFGISSVFTESIEESSFPVVVKFPVGYVIFYIIQVPSMSGRVHWGKKERKRKKEKEKKKTLSV